jgi:hypothetical protein
MAGIDSRNHLFFLLVVLAPEFGKFACSDVNCYTSWSELIDEGCRAQKSKCLMGTICRLILSFAVYWLWRARNKLKVGGQPLIEEQVLKQVFWTVRCRVSGKGKILKNYGECYSLSQMEH